MRLICFLFLFANCLIAHSQTNKQFRSLQTALEFPDSVFELVLNYNDFKTIPPEISKFKNLEKFGYISCPELTEDHIKSLSVIKGLKQLYLTVSFKSIPKNLDILKNLEALSIYANVDSIPSCLCKLQYLTNIEIRTSSPYFPPCIAKMTSLESIKFSSFTPLLAFPKIICDIPNLKTLEFTADSLKTLPNSFSTLKLESLTVIGAHSANVANKLFQLDYLKKLYIGGFNLKILPDSIRFLSIEEIDFTHNDSLNSSDLFDKLSKFNKLKSLELYSIKIDTIPKSIGLFSNLKRLEIEHGEVEYISKEFYNLTQLEHLEFINHIASLDERIANFKKLTHLNLSGNNGSSISSLYSLTSLEYLDISSSNISNLDKDLGNLKELKFLGIGGNDFKSIPKSIGKLTNLEFLELQNTKTILFPSEFFCLPNLKKITCFEDDLSKKIKRKIISAYGKEKLLLWSNNLMSW